MKIDWDKEADKYERLAEIWADLDGCEGGDYLRCLGSVCATSHYSGAQEQRVVVAIISMLIDSEIRMMREQATGPDSENMGYDEIQTEYTVKEDEKIRNGEW